MRALRSVVISELMLSIVLEGISSTAEGAIPVKVVIVLNAIESVKMLEH